MTLLQQIIANLKTALPDFDNTSQTDPLIKIADSLAPILQNNLDEQTNTQNIIQNIINTQNYGKSQWYVNTALAYQYGIPLIVNSLYQNVYAVVPPIDPTILIIKQAAFGYNTLSTGIQQLYLKIAMLDPITKKLKKVADTDPDYPNCFTDFSNYFLATAIMPGVPVSIVTFDPNLISFGYNNFTIVYQSYYTLAGANGLIAQITAAIDNFRNSFPFNGIFYTYGNYGLANYIINNVEGVIDVVLESPVIDGLSFDFKTTLSAGYFDFGSNVPDIETPASSATGIYAAINNVDNYITG
jgi:hypothetical protein